MFQKWYDGQDVQGIHLKVSKKIIADNYSSVYVPVPQAKQLALDALAAHSAHTTKLDQLSDLLAHTLKIQISNLEAAKEILADQDQAVQSTYDLGDTYASFLNTAFVLEALLGTRTGTGVGKSGSSWDTASFASCLTERGSGPGARFTLTVSTYSTPTSSGLGADISSSAGSSDAAARQLLAGGMGGGSSGSSSGSSNRPSAAFKGFGNTSAFWGGYLPASGADSSAATAQVRWHL